MSLDALFQPMNAMPVYKVDPKLKPRCWTESYSSSAPQAHAIARTQVSLEEKK